MKEGYYGNSLNRTYTDIYEFFLTAEKKKIFNSKFNVKFTLGASRWNYEMYEIRGHTGTWYYPNRYTFNNYTEPTFIDGENGEVIVDRPGDSPQDVAPGESILRQRVNSVFSFLNLSYDNYIFLELTGRNDWSSTLPPESNSYFYPSLSLSFIASEAFKIQEKINWLNFVKLRGGLTHIAADTEPYETDFNYIAGVFGGEQTTSFPYVIPPNNLGSSTC